MVVEKPIATRPGRVRLRRAVHRRDRQHLHRPSHQTRRLRPLLQRRRARRANTRRDRGRRGWDFVSTGHGDIPWEDAFRALASIGYAGPVSIEWEDAGMDRLHGAAEALRYIRSLLWKLPEASFDAAFSNQ
ncbi:hypothetical protein SVIO_108010 [Streptomyces violaceusniger]|uniref:Xylose isomerase-like TIM barrel domain-containing protein n=1 Tax=Streptomyces violaceusniger TaxID=68280 RepID=A0A4D4LP16_STRVO|nr:hypothetical protein SVIO_108010 [Streptomyces violaceusniger]